MPVVSITTRSNLSLPWSRFSFRSPRMRIKSPRTVQQMQPLFISTICSSVRSRISPSTPLSPNSFSITAILWPWSSFRMRLSSVVLPAPRKPVRMVTGTMFCSAMNAPCEGEILPLQHEQALQVVALGKLECDRVVGGGAEALDDLGVGAGVERRAGDDRLEQFGWHAAGAGEGGKQPAGSEQLERQQVDVLIGARRIRRVRRGRRELRRIEDDEIVPRSLIAQQPQMLEDVGRHELDAAGGQRIGRQVFFRDLDRVDGRFDGG